MSTGRSQAKQAPPLLMEDKKQLAEQSEAAQQGILNATRERDMARKVNTGCQQLIVLAFVVKTAPKWFDDCHKQQEC